MMSSNSFAGRPVSEQGRFEEDTPHTGVVASLEPFLGSESVPDTKERMTDKDDLHGEEEQSNEAACASAGVSSTTVAEPGEVEMVITTSVRTASVDLGNALFVSLCFHHNWHICFM